MTRPGHLAIFALAGLLAYANTFDVPFQFDDGKSVVENPAVADVAAFLAAPGIPTRAVGYFTFALNGTVHGRSVGGYHAVNLAIHLVAAFAVYLLAAFACRRAEPPSAALRDGAPVAALVAALLFVLHPIQTQAVTYVVQRLASLVTLLYAGSAVAYALAAVSPRSARRAALYGASLGLAALALFTKENAVTLPAALVLVEATLLQGTARERLLRVAPFWALLVAFFAVYVSPGGAIAAAAGEYREVPPGGLPPWASYLLSQPGVVLAYLRLVAFPVGQNVDHDPTLPSSPLDAAVLLPLAGLGLVLGAPAVLAWRARHRSALARIVLLAIGWLVLGLAVESSFVPLADAMFEHRMYLPMVGLCVVAGAAAASGYARLGVGSRRWARVAFGVLVLALGAATFARNAVWRDRLTLWTDALAKSPGKSRPYVYVAQDHLARGDARAAIALLERATALPAPAPHVFLTLGQAYEKTGEPGGAEAAYRAGIARGGGSLPGAHRALALLLLDSGRVAEACDELQLEQRVSPRDRATRDNAASCRYAAGDLAGAAAEWARLAEEDPRDAPVLYNLALAYAALGDVPRGRDAFLRFLAAAGPDLAPQQAEARRWLATRAAASPAP